MRLPQIPRKGMLISSFCKEVVAFLRSIQITSVVGGKFSRTPNGTILYLGEKVKQSAGGSSSSNGAFYSTRTVSSGDATDGDIYLQGGTVSGLGAPVPEILIYDASATAWQGTDGQVLQMKLTVDGTESSGIPNPGVTPTGTVVITSETTMGANTYPTGAGFMTGKLCHISLGTFRSDGFAPSNSGNINVGWCFGNSYTITRE